MSGSEPPPPPYGEEPPRGSERPYGGQPPYGGQQQPPYGQPYGAQPSGQPSGQPYGPPPYGYVAGPPRGIVPPTLDEIYYKPGLNMLLFFLTCGIWGGLWSWRTHDDLQKYNGDGLGGTVGLILGLLVSVAIMFTVPMEIERMYQRDGRQSPVSTLWGLWFLLPIIGYFIWYLKVQEALNEFWVSKGAQPR